MRVYDIIRKKRDGEQLSAADLEFIVRGYGRGEIPDYQMAAFLMAVTCRGLDEQETAALTAAMAASGERVDLSAVPGIKVDKHSTGGVGDKTTLVLAPLVAAAGVPVAKMSGRGLGHTGGTVDKLETIPGFRSSLTPEELVAQVRSVGVAVSGHTARLAPADAGVYALRDVTATVDSVPLIAASIMSKKMAGGADAVVLDVKCGDGAFMRDLEEALTLARLMVGIGQRAGLRTMAVISAMDEPLGRAVGNALEMKEAIAALAGEGPGDLRRLCLILGGMMLVLGGVAPGRAEAEERLRALLESGAGLERFRRWVAAQGGDPAVADAPELLPCAPVQVAVPAARTGYVTAVPARTVGTVAMSLGAGRTRKGDAIDPAVGIVLCRKAGEAVREGEPLAVVHARSEDEGETAARVLRGAITIADTAPSPAPLVMAVVDESGRVTLGG